MIGVLQGAEIELVENDGYDYARPLAIRVAINSLLAGLGVEPKDLQGEVETATEPGLVVWGREIARAVNNHKALVARIAELETENAALKEHVKDLNHDVQAAVNEANWQHQQGDEYGSY